MKINPFLLFCALIAGGLIFYGFHAAGVSMLYSVSATAVAAIALVMLLGVGCKDDMRNSMLLKTVSALLLVVSLPLNCVFAWLAIAEAVVIITNGLMLLVWAIVVYLLSKN